MVILRVSSIIKKLSLTTAFLFAMALPAHAVDDLASALASAYTKNPELQAAQASVRALDENVAAAVSGFRPRLDAHIDVGRERSSVANMPWNYDNVAKEGVTLTQPLYSGGRITAELKRQRQQVLANQAGLTATEQRVLLDAISAYTNVVEKQATLNLNERNVGVLQKQLDATNVRYEHGDLTQTDVAQGQSRLARAQASLRQAEGDLKTAEATFARVIGYPPQKRLDAPMSPPGLPGSMQEAITLAQEMNPELVAAMHLEQAASASVDAQKGALLPQLDLEGALVCNNGGTSVAVTSGAYDNDAIRLALSIPLYQKGVEYSRVRAAQQRLAEARFNTEDAKAAAVEATQRTWEDFRTSVAVIKATQESIDAAKVALSGVRQEHMFGQRTVLDVLDAEQELLASRVALIKARRTLTVQSYRLLAAVGRLNAQQLGLKVDIYEPNAHLDEIQYKSFGF